MAQFSVNSASNTLQRLRFACSLQHYTNTVWLIECFNIWAGVPCGRQHNCQKIAIECPTVILLSKYFYNNINCWSSLTVNVVYHSSKDVWSVFLRHPIYSHRRHIQRLISIVRCFCQCLRRAWDRVRHADVPTPERCYAIPLGRQLSRLRFNWWLFSLSRLPVYRLPFSSLTGCCAVSR